MKVESELTSDDGTSKSVLCHKVSKGSDSLGIGDNVLFCANSVQRRVGAAEYNIMYPGNTYTTVETNWNALSVKVIQMGIRVCSLGSEVVDCRKSNAFLDQEPFTIGITYLHCHPQNGRPRSCQYPGQSPGRGPPL